MKEFKKSAELRRKISDQLENQACFRDYSFAPIRLFNRFDVAGVLKVKVTKANWQSETSEAVSAFCRYGAQSIIFFV